MNHDITYYAKKRHTAKAYDSKRKISDTDIKKIKDILRFSASSTNAQPWHFIMASTEEGKARVAKATERLYPFNKQSILDASHVVVFCSRLEMTDEHLNTVLAQEEKDGRFSGDPETYKTQMDGARRMFVNLHKHDFKDVQHWMDKQVYLNIGQFLMSLSVMGIDATPMEGIDVSALDQEFGLRDKGYTSLVVVPIGYHHQEADYNAILPKSRLPYDYILTDV